MFGAFCPLLEVLEEDHVALRGCVHVVLYRGGPPSTRSTKLISWPLERSLTSPIFSDRLVYSRLKTGASALPLVTWVTFPKFPNH